MPGLSKREPLGTATDVFGRFDRMFDEWARMMPFWPVPFPRVGEAGDLIRVEEYREDGTLVIHAFSRSLPLPEGVIESDVTATYKAGVLEIRLPEPRTEAAKKIAISTS